MEIDDAVERGLPAADLAGKGRAADTALRVDWFIDMAENVGRRRAFAVRLRTVGSPENPQRHRRLILQAARALAPYQP